MDRSMRIFFLGHFISSAPYLAVNSHFPPTSKRPKENERPALISGLGFFSPHRYGTKRAVGRRSLKSLVRKLAIGGVLDSEGAPPEGSEEQRNREGGGRGGKNALGSRVWGGREGEDEPRMRHLVGDVLLGEEQELRSRFLLRRKRLTSLQRLRNRREFRRRTASIFEEKGIVGCEQTSDKRCRSDAADYDQFRR